MKIHLICVGKSSESWFKSGFEDYWRRLSPPLQGILHEIPTPKRQKQQATSALKDKEAEAIRSLIPKGSHIVALDEHGQSWTTQELANQLQQWKLEAKPVSLLIGGPDGLSQDCLNMAHQCWALSALTFPHPLARVIVAEQLYRAQSILSQHPYHRA